uniref:F-box domain-containing protein n=1 Tax=Leersia perrieri TaxID=77586 RepID=A0A0D9VNP2_9ORYZ
MQNPRPRRRGERRRSRGSSRPLRACAPMGGKGNSHKFHHHKSPHHPTQPPTKRNKGENATKPTRRPGRRGRWRCPHFSSPPPLLIHPGLMQMQQASPRRAPPHRGGGSTLLIPMELDAAAGDDDARCDFLDWVGHDTSACIFRCLDHPADIVRAAAVSRSWRRFVVDNEFSKRLCVRICPEIANFTSAEEVSRSALAAHAAAAESSHNVELKARERDYRIYSCLSGALVSTKPSTGCILHCIAASSTDYFPDETIENTLVPHDRVKHRPSYWSSGGQDDPDVPESLIYRLNSDMCIVDEIRLQPFEVYAMLK